MGRQPRRRRRRGQLERLQHQQHLPPAPRTRLELEQTQRCISSSRAATFSNCSIPVPIVVPPDDRQQFLELARENYQQRPSPVLEQEGTLSILHETSRAEL
eukprot:6181272-Pleurochrysis_carterae.AAC.1